jgi:hypothetical protein
MVVFNVGKLVADLGGARKVAEMLGVPRTAPYGWIRRNYLCTRNLVKLKQLHPDLNFDDYFEDDHEDDEANQQARCGA